MKPLLDLEPNDCRYAMNEGGPYLFCAEAKQEKSSYCPAHHEICNTRSQPHGGNPAWVSANRRIRLPAVTVLGADDQAA